MRLVLASLVLAAVALTAGAGTGTGGATGGFRAEIETRLESPLRRAQRRALLRARNALDRGGLLAEEARNGILAVRRLRRPFRTDATMAAAESQLAADVENAIRADRDLLDGWRGTLGDDALEAQLADGIGRADATLADLAGAPTLVATLRTLRSAALDLQSAAPPQPDFSLPDVNANSATGGRRVSPRDYADLWSAYYFGHAT